MGSEIAVSQPCIYICSAVASSQGRYALLLPIVFLLGLAVGNLGYILSWKQAHKQQQQQQIGARNTGEQRCCLLHRTASLEKLVKDILKPVTRPKPRGPDHANKLKRRAEEMSLQVSPKSDSSGSSSHTVSPLLVGTRKSPFSSLENSPSSLSPSCKKELEIPGTQAAGQGSPLSRPRKPEPVVIPSGPDDTLPPVAWMCSKDVMDLDDKWLDLVETSLEDIFGATWEQLIHPDDAIRCKDIIASAQNTKSPFQMEYRLKVLGDQFRWVLEIGKARCYANGDFVGFFGWRVDIHERKLIEEYYWDYWLLPHEYMVNWHGDGRYFDNVSPALPQLLGYTMEELKSSPYLGFVHPDDVPATQLAANQLKEGKRVVNFSNRYLCSRLVVGPVWTDSTGKYKWLMWTANKNFASCRDITSDKLAVEELTKSKEELARITDLIPGGVFVYRTTKEGQESFPYLSKGARKMLQLQQEDASQSRKVFGLNVHHDDFPKISSLLRQCVVSKTAFDHHFRVVDKDGGTWWVRVHAVPEVLQDGSTEWSALALDKTQQHELLDALTKAKVNAEKAAQAKATFLAHMSHEIRTPMNAVIGMGSLLLETELTAEQKEYASTIKNSGEALLGIINDILDYSKIEAGKMELELQPMEILHCLEESFDIIARQAADKGLELTHTISESIPRRVLGDVTRIRQILVNLLSNAVKFARHGSIPVVVEGRRVQDPTRPNLWEIEFCVTDHGIGIPKDRINCLFQTLWMLLCSLSLKWMDRLPESTVVRALALQYVDGCVGYMEVGSESRIGAGSTFHFTILAEEGRESNSGENGQLQGRRVLIVDSGSSSVQAMVSQLLRRLKMHVITSSSSESIKFLQQLSPGELDAVVFNGSLLDADAEDPCVQQCLSLCRRPKARIGTVLLTSGARMRTHKAENKDKQRFDAFVSKPVKQSTLYTALFDCIGMESTVQPPVPSKASEAGETYPLKILVAEDNLVNQRVIVKLLRSLGYTADVVENGIQALEAVSKQRYDVCLMDCLMPEMDGLEASRRMKQTLQKFPIIVAVTAGALEEERQACLQAGMDMWLCKPLSRDALLATLQKCWKIKASSM